MKQALTTSTKQVDTPPAISLNDYQQTYPTGHAVATVITDDISRPQQQPTAVIYENGPLRSQADQHQRHCRIPHQPQAPGLKMRQDRAGLGSQHGAVSKQACGLTRQIANQICMMDRAHTPEAPFSSPSCGTNYPASTRTASSLTRTSATPNSAGPTGRIPYSSRPTDYAR